MSAKDPSSCCVVSATPCTHVCPRPRAGSEWDVGHEAGHRPKAGAKSRCTGGKHGRSLPASDGLGLSHLCVARRGGAGADFRGDPLGGLHPLILNSAASWPETTAVLLTIVLTFFGAAACYRLGIHMNVTIGVDLLPAYGRRIAEFIVELLMAAMAVFMIIYGFKLCAATWNNSIAESPSLSVGLVYSPIPFGGAFTLLFIIEHLTIGRPAATGSRTYRSSRARRGPFYPRWNAVPVLCDRHADFLFTRRRRARRRVVDRHPPRR